MPKMDIGREISSPSPKVLADPYAFYAQLRKMGPVIPIKHPVLGKGYLITRNEDVFSGLKDPRLVNNRANAVEGGAGLLDQWWIPRILRLLQKIMLMQDEPDHRRLRDLIHKAFTPRMIERLTPRIDELVDELLNKAAKKPVVDLIADFALPLSLNLISEMLGVPEEERLGFFRAQSRLVEGLAGANVAGLVLAFPTAIGLARFFGRLLALRRERPGDDLTSALIRAEQAGDRFTEDELVSMIFMLLLAGHDTSMNFIGNGTLALLDHPDQLQKLYDRPELIDSAVEELLRFSGPVGHAAPRFAREDIEIQGHRIPKGSLVLMLFESANRDEAAFVDPGRLDIERTPNRHVALGYGIHYCVGAPLARYEGRSAFLKLVQRFPKMRLAVPRQELIWRKNLAMHGLKSLPMVLSPSAGR
ncbi:cytochrome P450 [Sorangium sp. So ce375]|uniref:cytochrome P450 family protein n=1 Tax=Sorangium sp. So ce375 TaxID=3133306 RepID=UPI003F5BDFEB